MTRLFQHIRTRQVVEVLEIRPRTVNFNGCIQEIATLFLHDWVLCEQDPQAIGRGMPPSIGGDA
jgi:hypothetical protein